jgi:hypothetical protein
LSFFSIKKGRRVEPARTAFAGCPVDEAAQCRFALRDVRIAGGCGIAGGSHA